MNHSEQRAERLRAMLAAIDCKHAELLHAFEIALATLAVMEHDGQDTTAADALDDVAEVSDEMASEVRRARREAAEP